MFASMPEALNRLSSATAVVDAPCWRRCIAGAMRGERVFWLSAIVPPNFWWSAMSSSMSALASSAVRLQASRMSSNAATDPAASWPVAVAYLRNFAVALSAALPTSPRSL